MKNRYNEFSGTIILTDPCYFAKDEDWREGGKFDYDSLSINSSDFTKYIWRDTGVGDGIWKVLQTDSILSQRELEEYIQEINEKITKDLSMTINQVEVEKLLKKRIPIGTLGVDSGTFGVFYLDEVLNYNPTFLANIDSSCFTVIKDFTGLIDTMDLDIEDEECASVTVILGIGNKTFFTES